MTNGEDEAGNALIGEAADLWLRLQGDPQDAMLRDEVRQWCARSARHEQIFAATQETWMLAGDLETLPMPLRSRARARRVSGRRDRRVVTALAAAAACLAIVAAPSLTLMWQSDYRTGTGEKRVIALADGSSVMLDTNSAIAVDYQGARRGVRLLAGRAWFDVAKNRERPFTVSAAEARVTVTGTAFDVGLDGDGVDVALAEGGVQVTGAERDPIAMKPGDRLHIAMPSYLVSRGQAAVSSMGSWRRDRLLLENVALSDGIEQLRRYHKGAIILTSQALGKRRVTGVYDVRTPDEALRLMVRQHGASVREITPWLLIVSDG